MEVKTKYGSFRAHRPGLHAPWYIGYFHVQRDRRGKGYGRRLGALLPVYCWLEASAWDLKHGALTQAQLTRFYFSLGFRYKPYSSRYMYRDLRKSGWPRKPR